ncbi:MAG: response regulator [Phycisphaerales bacterium]|nr:response regulator [Phycisphaerales bacterium]
MSTGPHDNPDGRKQPKRTAAQPQDGHEQPTLWPHGSVTPRVLVVSGSRVERESLTAKLTQRGMEVEPVGTPADALAAIATERFDLAMVQTSLGSGRGLELVRGLRELDGGLGIVMIAKKADLDDAVRAMQAGVLDYFVGKMDTAALATRLEQAVARARQQRTEQQRSERLRRVCRDVNAHIPRGPVREPALETPELDTDLATAYQNLTEQMAHVGLTAEFNSLIRQELDLECLLRTVLEFVLAKLGPTNAAIFLPSTTGDYTLGAYVNYDCPRDTAEVLLEHLAGVMPDRFEDEPRVVLMRSEHSLLERLGDQADWLDGHAVACFACRHDDECLAVVTLFRDRRTGFGDDQVGMLNAMADLFAQQLARVIQIHHRHLPKEQWGADASDDDAWEDGADDWGMAA